MIYGETGKEFSIMASCDANYLHDHAKGLVSSCALAKNNVHIHVTNPTEKEHRYLEYLKAGYTMIYSEGTMTSSYDTIDISKYNNNQKKTFYACNRFIVAPEIVKSDILILDIDCYLMQHIDVLDCDIGLFYRPENNAREWKGLAGKVAAGTLYASKNSLDFIVYAKEFILSNKLDWFLDQVALYESYNKFPNKKYHMFDNNFMDWEFKSNTKIWTGKGARKFMNTTYSNMLNGFKNKFPLKEQDYFNEKP
jgi:hypothetical protein